MTEMPWRLRMRLKVVVVFARTTHLDEGEKGNTRAERCAEDDGKREAERRVLGEEPSHDVLLFERQQRKQYYPECVVH